VDIQIEKGEGEEITIAFNYRYLLDLLTNIGTGDLIVELNGPLASGVFRLPSDKNFLHIVMPVRVQE
jgi:DNA polymerase III subunit beta